MSNVHTTFAMHALPAVTAGGVVVRVRDGNIPLPKRTCDFGIAFT